MLDESKQLPPDADDDLDPEAEGAEAQAAPPKHADPADLDSFRAHTYIVPDGIQLDTLMDPAWWRDLWHMVNVHDHIRVAYRDGDDEPYRYTTLVVVEVAPRRGVHMRKLAPAER